MEGNAGTFCLQYQDRDFGGVDRDEELGILGRGGVWMHPTEGPDVSLAYLHRSRKTGDHYVII